MSMIRGTEDDRVEVYEVPKYEAERTAAICVRLEKSFWAVVVEGGSYEFIMQATDLREVIAAGAGPKPIVV